MLTINKFTEKLKCNIQAAIPLTVIVTCEELRAINKLTVAANSVPTLGRDKWSIKIWDIARGWSNNINNNSDKSSNIMYSENSANPESIPKATVRNPNEAVETISKSSEKTPIIYVMLDVQPYLKNDPSFVRRVRNLIPQLCAANKRLILIQSDRFLPHELSDDAVVLPMPLPDMQELSGLIQSLPSFIQSDHCFKSDQENNNTELFTNAVKGLSVNCASGIIRSAIVRNSGLNGEAYRQILDEKQRLIAQTEALTYCDTVKSMDEIGGLKSFKKWLIRQKAAFTPFAREMGVPKPRGVLLAGISGSGKSSAAKATASVLELPLIKIEIGKIFSSFVGDSETNCSRMLSVLDAVSPCVCLLDELDKSFDSSSASTDSGTTKRVLGQILSYLQERDTGSFFVATCNRVEIFPPELIRKGRFASEIFFVDLASKEERKEIFVIHIKNYYKKIGGEDLYMDPLAEMTEGYTGAEIEAVVLEALLTAAGEKRPVKMKDITDAIENTIPLSVSMQEETNKMRALVEEGYFRNAR